MASQDEFPGMAVPNKRKAMSVFRKEFGTFPEEAMPQAEVSKNGRIWWIKTTALGFPNVVVAWIIPGGGNILRQQGMNRPQFGQSKTK